MMRGKEEGNMEGRKKGTENRLEKSERNTKEEHESEKNMWRDRRRKIDI